MDDLVWRILNKVISELIYHNSVSMMVLISTAMKNNAANLAVVSTGIYIHTIYSICVIYLHIKYIYTLYLRLCHLLCR